MSQTAARVIEGIKANQIPYDELFSGNEPVILRGLVSDWPIVKAGKDSAEKAMDLLLSGYTGKSAKVYVGDPEDGGRFHYNEDCTALNYHVETINVEEMFSRIKDGFNQPNPPYLYSPSMVYSEAFEGIQEDNSLRLDHQSIKPDQLVSKIWIGTQSIASAHFDLPSNFACCLVGKRRFTLFPPNQIHNIYPGPFNPTPGGQVITMANLRDPDFETYPRFKEALENSFIADMEPGDVLYYPSMWWHEVEAKNQFNVMVNYWWVTSPFFMADPLHALMLGILALRDRPENVKEAWKEVFNYYLFGPSDIPRGHLPEASHGVLGELDETMARRLRAMLQQSLNR